jgi:hypothetical protein
VSIRQNLRFKAVAAAITGISLLIESINSEFLRPRFDSWATLVNTYIAIFGCAFLLQSYFIVQQLHEVDRVPATPTVGR